MKNLVITTGDWDGIGLEVTFKALQKLQIKKGIRLFVFFSDQSEAYYKQKILKKFPVYLNLMSALSESKNKVAFIKNNLSPAINFEAAALLAKEGLISALVTAPLSKEEISRSGLKDNGHTDILRRVFEAKEMTMAFWGQFFSVVLATDHIALSKVAPQIQQKETVLLALKNAVKYAKYLSTKKNPSIGVLGLNPHAGEIESLGKEESDVLATVIRSFSKEKIPVIGPLVPDVCFLNPDYKKHQIYVAMYHDQGLIPFKIYHKKNHGIQISLNCPIVRTSVDHGTAKNIFGKRIADPTSMVLAIQKALEMVE